MSYDQFGDSHEPQETAEADEAPTEHDRRCRRGWIDRDADQPVPCLQCKPHLASDVRRRHLGLGDKK